MPAPLVWLAIGVARVVAGVAAQQAVKKVARQAVGQAAKRTAKQAAPTAAKVGNTPLNRYFDKAMQQLSKFCQKAVKKLGAHIHGRKGDVIKKGSGEESNHILQNALFEGKRGDGSDICSGYKDSRAPAIPLKKDTHASVTRRQEEWAQGHRDAGTQPTYDEARREARNQTRMTGANRKEAECVMKFVDQVFEQLCPDLVQSKGNNKAKLRTPRTRRGDQGKGGTEF